MRLLRGSRKLPAFIIPALAILVIASCTATQVAETGGPRNVILIIPDGCSIAAWAAARNVTVGVDGELNIEIERETAGV